MTTDEKAKFRYSAQEGVIELEGTEEFISSHMETLTDLVRVISRHTPLEAKTEKPQPNARATEDMRIVHLRNPAMRTEELGIIRGCILKSTKSSKSFARFRAPKKSEKSKNAAQLYCYGSELMGDEQVPSTEIRGVCEEHGCLDSTNFAKIFDDKTTFLVDGKKGGNKQVKLTFNGREKAVESRR